MAESGEEEMSASWWGGWLQTAKEKSMAALDMVRKDLTEFGCTMQNDAGHVVEVTSTTLKDSLKTENTSAAKEKLTKGLNTVLERLSQALVVPPDDEGQIPITASSADLYDRAKARIHAIQLDPGTYLEEPSGAEETYSLWCEGFDLEDRKGEISELLVSKVEVRGLYTKLVPSQVSHVEFWRRYFYKLHQMDVEQARKEALMKRADSAGAEDSISWDDDWSGDEAVAEDSGSDWEKLPRPNQHQRSRSPSPSPSPTRVPATPPTNVSEQSKDFQNVALFAAESQPEKKDQGKEGHVQETQQSPFAQSAETRENPVLSLSAELSVASSIPCPVQETSVVPPMPEQHSTDSFKDYLRLAAEGEEKTTEREEQQHSIPTPISAEQTRQSLNEASQPGEEISHPLPDLLASSPEPCLQTVSAPEESSAEIRLQEEVEASRLTATPGTSEVGRTSTTSPAGEGKVGKGAGEKSREVGEELRVNVEEEAEGGGELKTTEKGDLVVVGSDHGSPVSNNSGSKGLSDVDDEWEQDLDIELTEEEMKEAEDLAQKLDHNINLEEEDWENWE